MNARGWFYFAHRWVGLVVSAQLLAWSVGGFAFSLLMLDDVRGERERRRDPRPPLQSAEVSVPARQALGSCANAARVVLQMRLGRPVYDVFDLRDKLACIVDAQTGAVRSEITADEATALAKLDFQPDAPIASVTRIERDPPSEYRGRPLPAYAVAFDHPKAPHIYVSAATGEITARRNARWRLHDFFWMLHVMDYRERESYNHALMTTASALAIVTAATGVVLQLYRFRRRAS